MPKELTMIKIRDVITKLKESKSLREIQQETGTHRQVIRRIRGLAINKGWLEEATPLPGKRQRSDPLNRRFSDPPFMKNSYLFYSPIFRLLFSSILNSKVYIYSIKYFIDGRLKKTWVNAFFEQTSTSNLLLIAFLVVFLVKSTQPVTRPFNHYACRSVNQAVYSSTTD